MIALTPESLRATLAAVPLASQLWVAYSGGLDSTVLLHALALSRQERPLNLIAIHVNHGLNPAASDWVDHCRRFCEGLGVRLVIRHLNLRREPGRSLEAMAREERYAVLRDLAGPGDLVLTAHHQDDQAETLLLALVRGSGIKGLSSMPAVAPLGEAWLLRPLLKYGRKDLLAYARRCGLSWVEDGSNANLGLDRNFLRARVLPVLAERWPSCAASLARTAGHCAEAQQLVDGLAEREMVQIAGSRPDTLLIPGLAGLTPDLQAAVLRHWIGRQGLPTPSSRHLCRIRHELLEARPDRMPLVTWPGGEARRYRLDLYVMAPLPPLPGKLVLNWRRGELDLPPGLGRLQLLDGTGAQRHPDLYWPAGLKVGFGVEGVRLRPLGHAHHRSLKNLFQEAGIPPWLRPYVPCLSVDSHLVGVGDLWRSNDNPFVIQWLGGIRQHPAWLDPGSGGGSIF